MPRQNVKFTPLINLATGCVVVAIGLAVLGVASLLNAIRGGPALGVLTIVIAAGILALGGYFIWGYGWLRKRPELTNKAEQQNARERRS
jgi:hypothetical protein